MYLFGHRYEIIKNHPYNGERLQRLTKLAQLKLDRSRMTKRNGERDERANFK